jgi:hypothetical protein
MSEWVSQLVIMKQSISLLKSQHPLYIHSLICVPFQFLETYPQ